MSSGLLFHLDYWKHRIYLRKTGSKAREFAVSVVNVRKKISLGSIVAIKILKFFVREYFAVLPSQEDSKRSRDVWREHF